MADRRFAGRIDIVVLKPFTEEFSIELYAYDGDNDQSDNPVVVKFSASTDDPVDPRMGTYAVKQQKDNGDFEAVRVGNRLDTAHGLTFATGFFNFAANLNTVLTKKDRENKEHLADSDSDSDVPSLIVTNSGICEENKVPEVSETLGEACYTYTTSDKVEVNTFDAATPAITFELPSSRNGLNSGRATITIKYHVWAYQSKHVHGDLENPIPANAPKKIHTATETLTLNIHKCVVATDCPINSDS